MTISISDRMLEEAYAAYVKGSSLREVAGALYIHHVTLRDKFVKAGYPYPIRHKTFPRKTERNLALIRDFENGIRGKALVRKYSLSKQRIRAIVKSQSRSL